MNKTKETMAREYNFQLGSESDHQDELIKKCFIAGFDAGQAQLLEQASANFSNFCLDNQWVIDQDCDAWYDKSNCAPRLVFERVWQASQVSSAKLLAEKDAEIERLRSIKSHQSDVIDMKSRLIAEKDKEIKLLSSRVEYLKQGWEASNKFNNDRIEQKRKELESAKELIKEMRDTLSLLKSDGGHLVSVVCHSFFDKNTDKIKALLGEE